MRLLERRDIPLELVLGGHAAWMAPVANIPFFLALALLLVTVGRKIRADRQTLLLSGLTALAAFAVFSTGRALHPLAVLVLSGGLGAQMWRMARPRPSSSLAFFRRTLPALLLLVVLVGSFVPIGRHIREERALRSLPAPTGNETNVLLIILDTVRARSLSLYGHHRPTTPFLEELAARSIVFDKAIATAPWTLPSHGSMFTGRLARELSVRFNRPLDDTYPTLAEELAKRGYETAGFVANLAYGARKFGLARGFLHYEGVRVSAGQTMLSSSLWRYLIGSDFIRRILGHADLLNRKSADDVSTSFLSWLDSRNSDRPFFAFLNLFDAHEPYLPPAPFDTLFEPARDSGDLEHTAHLILGHWAARTPKQHSSADDWAADRAAYEGAIAYMDRELGRLLRALDRRAVLDRTLLIVTSDHGEQHGERDMYEHTSSVYMPLIHVPLLIRLPHGARGGTRVPAPASLRDIPATVMDRTQAASEHPFPGRSLARFWIGTEKTAGAAALSDHLQPVAYLGRHEWGRTYSGPLHSVVTARHHYIQVEGGDDELFDLARDPEETENLAADPKLRDVVDRLRGRVLSREDLASRDRLVR